MAIIWNLATLISLSWNLPNDELALKNELSRLELSWSSLDIWLNFWTLVVVVGVAVELVVIIVEYRHAVRDFRRGIVRPPDRPSRLILAFGLLGAGFVAIGVAGEFFIHTKAGRVETEMRDATGSLVAIVNGKASKSEQDAAQLRTDLERAKGETKAAEAKLEKEQGETDHAQEEAAKAQLALKKYVTTVAERQRARGVDRVKLLRMLEGKPKSSIVLLYNPNDSEAYWLADMLFMWLGKGNGDAAGAGWDVAPPKPIPPNAGNRGGHPPDAPPAMHFGGTFTGVGITFVVNETVLRQEIQIGSSFQSFTAAVMSSITPRENPIGYSFISEGDNAIPDGVIWVVVGPKPPVMFPDELKLGIKE